MFFNSFGTPSNAPAISARMKPTRTSIFQPSNISFSNRSPYARQQPMPTSPAGMNAQSPIASAQNYQPFFMNSQNSITRSSSDPMVTDSDLTMGPKFDLFTEQGWVQKMQNDRSQIALHDFRRFTNRTPQSQDILSEDSRVDSLRSMYSLNKPNINPAGLSNGMSYNRMY